VTQCLSVHARNCPLAFASHVDFQGPSEPVMSLQEQVQQLPAPHSLALLLLRHGFEQVEIPAAPTPPFAQQITFVNCSDLEAATAFYRDVVGLPIAYSAPGDLL
jgi:hypothetical protein